MLCLHTTRFYCLGLILLLIFSTAVFSQVNAASTEVKNFTNRITINEHKLILSVAWNLDGRILTSSSEDNTIKNWDAATGKFFNNYSGQNSSIFSVAWSPDGSKLASGYADNTIKIWQVDPELRPLKNFTLSYGHANIVRSVAWSPDGNALVSASDDGTIKIWDLQNHNMPKTINVCACTVFSVAWSPDGKKIASGSSDNNNSNDVKLWDVATATLIMTLNYHDSQHNGPVYSVAWSPDGSRLSSASADGTIKIWDTLYGTNIKTLTVNPNITEISVAWSPDGSKLASGSGEGPIRIWETSSWVILTTLYGHSGRVAEIAWSPDGSELASGSSDGTIRIWGGPHSHVYVESLIAEKYNITIGENVNITANFINDGDANGGNIHIAFYDTEVFLTNLYLNVSCNASVHSKYLWHTTNSTVLGNHHLQVRVGLYQKNVTILVKGRPHINIKDIFVNTTHVDIGNAVKITAILVNDGPENALNIPVVFYDGVLPLKKEYVNITINSIVFTTIVWNTTNATPIGNHLLQVNVDTSWKNIIITVIGKPNVYALDLYADKSNSIKGDNIIITALIKNNGTADAINVNVTFYLDKTVLKIIRANITKDETITSNLEWNTKNMTIGNHSLKVVAENSSKQITVHITQGPANKLDLPFPLWILILIIALVLVVILFLGYFYYQNQKRIP